MSNKKNKKDKWRNSNLTKLQAVNKNKQEKNYDYYPADFSNRTINKAIFPEYQRHNSDDILKYFKGFGCSFKLTTKEIIIGRCLYNADFTKYRTTILSIYLTLILFIPLVLTIWHPLPLQKIKLFYFKDIFIFFDLLSKFFSSILFKNTDFMYKLYYYILCYFILPYLIYWYIPNILLSWTKIKVNSNGIKIKTIFKQYFLPKEKIDCLVCKRVKKKEQEDVYNIFIKLKKKDKKLFNKLEIDTGLCYKNKIHVDYLVDMFNERLGFL